MSLDTALCRLIIEPRCLLRRHDDDQQPSAKDSENNSEDTPEFMNRLFAGVKSRRRVSQRERDFEQALERQKWKQARSDEFFGIYRRVFLFVRSGKRLDWILP